MSACPGIRPRQEGRLQPRRAALALTGLDERGFVTADVCPGAHLDAEVESIAEQPFVAKLGELLFQILPEIGIFGAQIDDATCSADRVGRDIMPTNTCLVSG